MEELKTQLIEICDTSLQSDTFSDEEKAKIARLRAYVEINIQ